MKAFIKAHTTKASTNKQQLPGLSRSGAEGPIDALKLANSEKKFWYECDQHGIETFGLLG